jgi:hypothetical protein
MAKVVQRRGILFDRVLAFRDEHGKLPQYYVIIDGEPKLLSAAQREEILGSGEMEVADATTASGGTVAPGVNGNGAANASVNGAPAKLNKHVELHELKDGESLFKELNEKWGLSIDDYYLTQEESVSGEKLATRYALVSDANADGTGGKITDIAGVAQICPSILHLGKHGIEVKRFKGLGEMNAEQLWETTLDPTRRTLLRVDVAGGRRSGANVLGADGRGRRTAAAVHRSPRARGEEPGRVIWPSPPPLLRSKDSLRPIRLAHYPSRLVTSTREVRMAEMVSIEKEVLAALADTTVGSAPFNNALGRVKQVIHPVMVEVGAIKVGAGEAVRTTAEAQAKVADGVTLLFARGETFEFGLNLNKRNVKVGAFGAATSPNPVFKYTGTGKTADGKDAFPSAISASGENLTIEDIDFDGGTSHDRGRGVDLTGKNVTVRRCNPIGGLRWFAQASGCDTATIESCGKLKNLSQKLFLYCGPGSGGRPNKNITVKNCISSAHGEHVIRVHQTQTMTITGCDFDGSLLTVTPDGKQPCHSCLNIRDGQ